MFVEEIEFIDYLEHIKVEVDKRTNHHVVFEEYVIVPFFGFIILRFNLSDNIVTLDELDGYETQLYEIVGDNYLVDFMGTVYHRVGVDFTKLSDILSNYMKSLKVRVSILILHTKQEFNKMLKSFSKKLD